MKQSFVLPFVFVSVLSACDGGTPMMMNGVDTTCAASPAAVTMASLQTDIFDPKCKSCHYKGMGGMADGSGYAYGDYETTAQTFEMVNKTSLYNKMGMTSLKIVDGDTSKTTAQRLANSTLWLKVSTKMTLGYKGPNMESTGARMPNDGSAFADSDIQKIKDWICRGAPMN
jgi:hypothetical protein